MRPLCKSISIEQAILKTITPLAMNQTKFEHLCRPQTVQSLIFCPKMKDSHADIGNLSKLPVICLEHVVVDKFNHVLYEPLKVQ